MSRRKFRIYIAVLSICFAIILYCITLILIFNRDVDLKPKPINYSQYLKAKSILEKDLHKNPCCFSNSIFKSYIENDMNLSMYIYCESRLRGLDKGITSPIFRTIIIDEELRGYDYCETFAHEAIHLKYILANERYVCFETFKYLYENNKLHDVGVWYGYNQVVHGHTFVEYNISDLVIDYLTNK